MKKPWSPDELEALRRLSVADATLTEMSAAIGRSRVACHQKCSALGLPFRDGRSVARVRVVRWTTEQVEELRLMAATQTPSTLAEHFGIAVVSMRIILRSHGIKARRPRRSDEHRRAMSESARARWEAKYPPEGPWECSTCGVAKPVTEFPRATSQHMCRDCRRVYHVATTYGITVDDYGRMLAAQAGACVICKQPETKRHHKTGVLFMMAVDHDHSCCPGKKSCGQCVRALLCSRCNSVLGHVEGHGLLGGLQDYLLRFASKDEPQETAA